jgi:hypothetical protein
MPTERDLIRSLIANAPEDFRKFLERVEVAHAQQPEPMTIVCAMDPAGITGAKQTECSGCRGKIWLSPSTQQMLAERGDLPTKLICPNCMFKAIGPKA